MLLFLHEYDTLTEEENLSPLCRPIVFRSRDLYLEGPGGVCNAHYV
jgi:hypothetical protein